MRVSSLCLSNNLVMGIDILCSRWSLLVSIGSNFLCKAFAKGIDGEGNDPASFFELLFKKYLFLEFV